MFKNEMQNFPKLETKGQNTEGALDALKNSVRSHLDTKGINLNEISTVDLEVEIAGYLNENNIPTTLYLKLLTEEIISTKTRD